jgi:hypothetical protein
MPGIDILDVAISLVFLYLIISLISTVLVEIVEKFLNQRGANLLLGLKEMINDPDGDKLIKAIFEHSDIFPSFQGAYTPDGKNLPPSIPAPIFAKALLNVILPDNKQTPDLNGIRQAVASMEGNEKLKTTLTLIVNKAGTDLNQVHQDVAAWYDANMVSVSGWYKKHTQNVALLMGFLVALAFNADTIGVSVNLSKDRALRDSFVAVAQGYAQTNNTNKDFSALLNEVQGQPQQIAGLPIGWSESTVPQGFGTWLLKIIGLAFTALAASLGASFWFDLLKNLISVRNDLQPKPEQKS